MTLSNARSNTRRATENGDGPQCRADADAGSRYRTAVAVTGSTKDGYAPLLETIDDLARALSSVLGAVVWEPLLEVET